MSYLDRSRVPPDVARRLVALAASPSDDHPPGAPRTQQSPAVAPRGWTPGAPPAARPADVPGTSPPVSLPTEVLPDASPASPGPTASDAGPWRPSVTAALAAAAEASPPVVVRPRVRWAPGWRTTGAAVLVLALVAGASVLRAAAVPHGEPVVVPAPAAPGRAGPDGVPASAPSTPAVPDRVVVHVVGAVAQPGVVHLAPGARVADAIVAAGGSAPEADLAALNLARVVADGEQLVVPVVGAPPAAPAAAADGLVDLNTADEVALQELPGVGPVLAGRIVQHRAERPFTTVDELDDVPGVGPALMADLRPRVRV